MEELVFGKEFICMAETSHHTHLIQLPYNYREYGRIKAVGKHEILGLAKKDCHQSSEGSNGVSPIKLSNQSIKSQNCQKFDCHGIKGK